MKFLYAHWRVDYIDAPKDPKSYNPFLEILNNPDEKKSLLLFRTPLSFVILNKYPYNAGHLLALPCREIQGLHQLTAEEHTDFFQTVVRAERILKEALNPDGINIGINLGAAAGAGIPRHLHCHLVPRWTGDTNFMPIIADTKTLPVALEHLWENLRKFI
ncbi:MAG: HIT domain-containing protein [Puniceicoccales bacterium]|jgi:ATP adenylyltransferase|nr:HIT domain-containing protein [Puniceicoccales bacterium]